jgi:hypothetical protein
LQQTFDDAARYFVSIGVDVGSSPFQIAFDSTRITDIVQYDSLRGGIVGYVGGTLSFDSLEEAQNHYATQEAAKFVMVFILAPLDGNLPSAYRIAAIVPQPGSFPSSQVQTWLNDVLNCARVAGFGQIVAVGADGDSRHRKITLQLMRNVEGRRFVGDALGSIMTLFPILQNDFPFCIVSDPSHWLKKVWWCALIMHSL